MSTAPVGAKTSGWPLTHPLVSDTFLQNPYSTYQALREAGPIHWSEEFFGGAWLVTRYADVETVLRDARYSARRTGGWLKRVSEQSEDKHEDLCLIQRLFGRAMLFLDAPDHPRVRQVLNAGFRPTALHSIAPYIGQCVAELTAGVDLAAAFDFMETIARPLPARVIARLMGIEQGTQADFVAWSDDLVEFIGAPQPTREMVRRAQVSLMRMSAVFERLLADRRKCGPGSDLVGLLLQAGREGKISDGAELLAQCAMLLFAGYETTRNLLGNGLYALLRHPSEWQRLRKAPELLSNALRELLRFDSPVQYTGRRVAKDHVLHGRHLKRGQLVIALIGAANRDPGRFRDPDRLDIARREGSHLSFGHGPHVCVGAALTLMEAESVFRAVLDKWPDLTLADMQARLIWRGNAAYRG
jgi:cytochrome P450